MSGEIFIFGPQFDTSVSTILRTDSLSYYNFDSGNYKIITEEDKLSIIKNYRTGENENLNNSNNDYFNHNQLQITQAKDSGKDYFIRHFLSPMFDTNYSINPETGNNSNFNFISHKTEKPKATRTSTTQSSLKNFQSNTALYHQSKDWIIIILLLFLFIISWLRLSYYKSLQQILKSAYNFQLSQKYYRERNAISQRASLILNIIFILSFSLFIYFTFNFMDIKLLRIKGFLSYLIYCGLISLIYMGKFLIYKSLGWLLSLQKYFSEFLYNFFIYEKILGVLIIPVVIGIPFMPAVFLPELINTGLGLIIFCLVIRTIRGIRLSFKLKVSILYIILYLCTLEILPILIFVKLIALSR